MSLSEINHYDRNAEISSIFNINSKHINSLKFFKEAQVLLINHAFNKLNLRRVGSFVSDKKLAKLNEKIFGFKCEGQLKERDYVNGKFVDKYILSILKKIGSMKLNDSQIALFSKIGQRATFGLSTYEIAKKNSNLIVLTSDVSTSAGLDRLKSNLKNQFIDVYIRARFDRCFISFIFLRL